MTSQPRDKFLALSGSQPIDWEWIADWAERFNVEKMVFARFGENVGATKAIAQLQTICERAGGQENVFDVSLDIDLTDSIQDMILFETTRSQVQVKCRNCGWLGLINVQIRNLFGSLLTEIRGKETRAGNVTIEVDGTDMILYNPIIHLHRASRYNFNRIPMKTRKVMGACWDRWQSQVHVLRKRWDRFTGRYRQEWKRRLNNC